MTREARVGKVIAVCKSAEHGFPTYPQEMVSIGLLGIEGDAHSGELRESFTKPGTMKPNDRPISNGVTLEVVDHAYPCKKLEDHNGPGLIQALAEKTEKGVFSRRGILCRVLEPGDLMPGTQVRM